MDKHLQTTMAVVFFMGSRYRLPFLHAIHECLGVLLFETEPGIVLQKNKINNVYEKRRKRK